MLTRGPKADLSELISVIKEKKLAPLAEGTITALLKGRSQSGRINHIRRH